MPSRLVSISAITAITLATLYQLFLRDFLFIIVGLGRTVQPLEDFPYTCRRLKHRYLEACEDLWLDDGGRRVYLTCAGTNGRLAWDPVSGHLNVSGRLPGGSYISVLNIDEPGQHGLFGVHQLDRPNYKGSMSDGSAAMVGFDVEVAEDDILNFYIVNRAPPVDEQFQIQPASKGANAHGSIEVFEHRRGSREMMFRSSFKNSAIRTPNNVVLTGEGGLVFTNDHSALGGLMMDLEPFTGGGSLGYCSLTSQACHIAATSGFNFPNGLIRGTDNLYYVPNTMSGKVSIMELQPDKSLKEVDSIKHVMAMDNLSRDEHGDIWGTGFSSMWPFLASVEDPWNKDFPTTVWRIRRNGRHGHGHGKGRYDVKKMVEDRDARVVAGGTTVVHDVKTGRLFMGGFICPYVVVCDPKQVSPSP